MANVLWLTPLHGVLGAAETSGAVLAHDGAIFVLVFSSGCVVTGHRNNCVLVDGSGALVTSDAEHGSWVGAASWALEACFAEFGWVVVLLPDQVLVVIDWGVLAVSDALLLKIWVVGACRAWHGLGRVLLTIIASWADLLCDSCGSCLFFTIVTLWTVFVRCWKGALGALVSWGARKWHSRALRAIVSGLAYTTVIRVDQTGRFASTISWSCCPRSQFAVVTLSTWQSLREERGVFIRDVVTRRGRNALFLEPCTFLRLVRTFRASIGWWVRVCAFWAPVASWAAVLGN